MRGFIPILVIIPIALISFASVVITTFNEPKPISTSPESISRSILDTPSPSPLPSQAEEPSLSPSPSLGPSPSPKDDPTIEAKTIAKEAPSPKPKPITPSNTSSGGNYTVATFNLASVTVVTSTANNDDCSNDCPTKSLLDHISENGGRAGINGTYFCPPDYSSCTGKVNSFDFSVWNNNNKKWINGFSLFWNGRGMMVFRPGSAQFYPCAACVGAPSDITGGITNYPPLLAGGKKVLDEGSIPSSLSVTKGTRGAIGFGNGKLFLVVARSANMQDLVNIFLVLGATDAMNLDGGGSTALYDGGYRAGPGRSLPNAIVVK